MNDPETLYSTTWTPDPTRALDVLAFLLVPEVLFVAPGDDAATVAAVHDVLHSAKREALLGWYASHLEQPVRMPVAGPGRSRS